MTAPPRRNTAHTLQVSWSGDRLLLVAGRPDHLALAAPREQEIAEWAENRSRPVPTEKAALLRLLKLSFWGQIWGPREQRFR